MRIHWLRTELPNVVPDNDLLCRICLLDLLVFGTDERHCVNSMSLVFLPAEGGDLVVPTYIGHYLFV